MLGALKVGLVTGGVGVVAVLAVSVALLFEKNAHATTKQALADEMGLVATIRGQQATAAVERAQAVSEALAAAQADMDRQIEQENQLRAELAAAAEKSKAERRSADLNIARLKRENAEIRDWADTAIPGGWVDWMLNPADEAATATPP